jgi:hypothetical protein
MKSEIQNINSEIEFEPRDLLLFYGRDVPSRIIELATRVPSQGHGAAHFVAAALGQMLPKSRNRPRIDGWHLSVGGK